MVGENYVEVIADGVKTTGTLFNELFALINTSKLQRNSTLEIINSDGTMTVYKLSTIVPNSIVDFGTSLYNGINNARLMSTGSILWNINFGSGTVAFNDQTTRVFEAGRKFRIAY